MSSLDFFHSCLWRPGPTDRDRPEDMPSMLLCYDTTIQDTVLLQRNIHQHSLLPPPQYFPTKKEDKKDSCTASFSTATATVMSFQNTTTCKWLLKKNPQSEPWSVPPLQFIIPEHIHISYPIDLLTRLGHPDHTKTRWIRSTCLYIYASLDLAKNDFSHPVWSVVNTCFLCKRPSCCGTAIAYFWNNFLSTVSLPVWRLPNEKPSFDYFKFFLLIVVLLRDMLWIWWVDLISTRVSTEGTCPWTSGYFSSVL